ncbi:MAG: GspE/PulE family protein, partial [Mariprofundus sp.]
MIGEIRDLETAEIAIQASLTGHLVLATLHTNDALSAILRLQDMGLEPYLVASSLTMVQAQRLVRRLCPQCKQPRAVNDEDWRMLEVSGKNFEAVASVYDAKGCDACMGTGYSGRVAIYEMTRISDAMRNAIHDGKGLPAMRRLAKKEAMDSLRQDGARHVAAGVTTVDEVLRVTMEEAVRSEP